MATGERLQQLRDKLRASERMGPGYQERIEALKAEIAKLEQDSGTANQVQG